MNVMIFTKGQNKVAFDPISTVAQLMAIPNLSCKSFNTDLESSMARNEINPARKGGNIVM